MSDWKTINSVDPTALTATRVQVHYAALILGSVAHSTLEHADDDSHSNLGFARELGSIHTRTLPGDVALHLDLESFALLLRSPALDHGSLALEGQTLASGLAWASAGLSEITGTAVEINQRAYPDFPASPLMTGSAFELPSAKDRTEIAHWFHNGLDLLETVEGERSEIRIWPHHFDLGTLRSLGGERMLGLGLSIGDDNYDQPYFYCSPYPQPSSNALPPLALGAWHVDGFVSAVLQAEQLSDQPEAGAAAANYLDSAMRACQQLLD